MKDCQCGDKSQLRRRREREERGMDDAMEKLLLELARRAFSALRIARVRARAARVADSSKARMVLRNRAMSVRGFHRRPVGHHEEQQAAQHPTAFRASAAHS